MNSIFCAVKDDARSTSSSSPESLNNFFFFTSIFRSVPESTEYFCSSIGVSSLFRIGFPFWSTFLTQFLRSTPIPPVTPTVVRKIGETPFVPATIGAEFTNGTYGLDCFPVHKATLLIPDILEDPTPIVPFSATSIMRLSGCFSLRSSISF